MSLVIFVFLTTISFLFPYGSQSITRHCPRNCYCPSGKHGSEATACTLDTREQTLFPCSVKLLRLRLRISKESPPTLPDNLFALCNYVEDLQLQPGKVERLQRSSLLGLDKLARLVVTRGSLKHLGPKLLESTLELAFLKLSANKIQGISASTFASCAQLVFIDLSGNEIATIDSGSFQACRLLATMNMGGNKLARVAQSTLSGLAKLTKLILTDNEIETVEDFAFSHTSRLRALLLNKNRLRVLTKYALAKLYGLERLDLSYNKLSYLAKGAFQDMMRLKSLYLQGNELISLQWSTFQGLGPSLQDLELGALECVIEINEENQRPTLSVIRAFADYQLCIGTRPVTTTTAYNSVIPSSGPEINNATSVIDLPAADRAQQQGNGSSLEDETVLVSKEIVSNLFYSNDAAKPIPSKRSDFRFGSSPVGASKTRHRRLNPVQSLNTKIVEVVPVWLAATTGFFLLAFLITLLALVVVCRVKTAKIDRLKEAQQPPFPMLLKSHHHSML